MPLKTAFWGLKIGLNFKTLLLKHYFRRQGVGIKNVG